jgi:hypothetical protein
MQAVLDPLGPPLATEVVAGERADAPLSMPCIERVQARLGQHGRLEVGNWKMASRDTRARLAAAGDYSWCPRPQGHLAAGEFDAALEAVCPGAHALRSVRRQGPPGALEVLAAGYASPVAMSQQGDGTVEHWTERRLVGRSVRQAQAAAAALRARVAKARAPIAALNQSGRGQKRFETVSALRQAVVAMVQRDGVEALLGLRLYQHDPPRPVRASRGQPARVDHDRHATVEVCGDEAALAATSGRLGWRLSSTNPPLVAPR